MTDAAHVDRSVLLLDSEESVERFVDTVLLDAQRTAPVVVVSTHRNSSRAWFDVQALASELGEHASVALLETGPASWALTASLAPRFDVFGGAFRLYGSDLANCSDPFAHPLFLPRSQREAEAMRARLVHRVTGEEPQRRVPGPHSSPWGAGAEDAEAAAEREQGWTRLADTYGVGDVLLGRVEGLATFGAFIELLPGVKGLVHKSEIDWDFVHEVGDFVQIGQRVKVKILSMEAAQQRCELSIKHAFLEDALPGIGLRDEDEPFVDGLDEVIDRDTAEHPQTDDPQAEELERLAHELAQSEDERRALAKKVSEANRELRSLRDRVTYLESELMGGRDPSASPEAFLHALRTLFSRTLGDSDQRATPLKQLRVGPEFLQRLRDQLASLSLDKVLEVCVQVACGRAHRVNAREVHQLRAGPPGSPTRQRPSDGAQAWRCSLQDGTAAARRLHWWAGVDAGGEWIEFAHVGVHDDMSIPE